MTSDERVAGSAGLVATEAFLAKRRARDQAEFARCWKRRSSVFYRVLWGTLMMHGYMRKYRPHLMPLWARHVNRAAIAAASWAFSPFPRGGRYGCKEDEDAIVKRVVRALGRYKHGLVERDRRKHDG